MIQQDCLSYNLIFTSKVGDLLLYIQNSRSTFALQDNGTFLTRNVTGHSDPPDQLDTKGLPSRGRNLSLNERFCHQKVIQ